MGTYLVLKWIHILSSTVLFGTGIGIAFFKWITDRTGDVRAIRIVSERTVLADWVFTTPAVVIQPVTGLAIAQTMGYSLRTSWILGSLLLWSPERAGFPWSGFSCRRDLARRADDAGTGLSEQYRRLNVIWFWLGVPAFSALVAVFWLMVAKPAL